MTSEYGSPLNFIDEGGAWAHRVGLLEYSHRMDAQLVLIRKDRGDFARDSERCAAENLVRLLMEGGAS